MDRRLAERLSYLSQQNDILKKTREAFLLKEASRKHFEASLIKAAEGKSHAEKTINAQATSDWKAFHMELAALETEFEFEKLKYDILDKAYLAEHLTFKLDAESIKRQL